MARPQQLQPGQLNPQSQPVSTFIQSTPKNVAGAAQPQLLPQTPQLQTSQTGGRVGGRAGGIHGSGGMTWRH